MKKLKSLWDRLPKLPRKWRIVRNLLLAPLLLVLAMSWGRWPSWAGYWAFRQMESSYLLTPSRLVCSVEGAEWDHWGAYLTEGEGWIAAGKSTAVQTGGPWTQARAVVNHVLAKEGVVVVALPGPDQNGAMTAAVWGAPAEAVFGEIEMDLLDVEGSFWKPPKEEIVSGQTQRTEDGWFFFKVACVTDHGQEEHCALAALWDWDARILYNSVGERPYRLTLTDSRGAQVVSQAGTLPPNLWLTEP